MRNQSKGHLKPMVAKWQLGILRNTDNPDYLIWILLLLELFETLCNSRLKFRVGIKSGTTTTLNIMNLKPRKLAQVFRG